MTPLETKYLEFLREPRTTAQVASQFKVHQDVAYGNLIRYEGYGDVARCGFALITGRGRVPYMWVAKNARP